MKLFNKKHNSSSPSFRPKWFSTGIQPGKLLSSIRNHLAVFKQFFKFNRKQSGSTTPQDNWKDTTIRILQTGNPGQHLQKLKSSTVDGLKEWTQFFLPGDIKRIRARIAASALLKRQNMLQILLVMSLLIITGDSFVPISHPPENTFLEKISTGEKQAATYPFHASPFYFPFKTKPTSMNKTEPFSQIEGARHNSHGFRTREYTIAHPPNVFRIVVIGDEITYGSGVDLNDTFSNKTAYLLNDQCSKTTFEFIALGGLGHRLADNLIKLMVHGQKLNPDLVILQMSFNDIEFEDYLNTYAIRGGRDYLHFINQKVPDVMKRNSIDRKIVSESIFEIQKWSSNQRIPVAFLIFPFVDNDPSGRNFSHYDPKDPRASHYLDRFTEISDDIRTRGIPLLDLTPVFRERAGDRYMAVSMNNGNPNSYAHGMAAESLVPFLQERKLAPCSPSSHPIDPKWAQESILRKTAAEEWEAFNRNYDQQLLFYKKIQELYPDDAWSISLLADVYYGLEQWETASHLFSSLVQFQPQYSAPWYQIAQCSNNPLERVQLLERMIQQVPHHNLSMEQLSEYYAASQRINESCQLLTNLLQKPGYYQQYELSRKRYTDYGCERLKPRPVS